LLEVFAFEGDLTMKRRRDAADDRALDLRSDCIRIDHGATNLCIYCIAIKGTSSDLMSNGSARHSRLSLTPAKFPQSEAAGHVDAVHYFWTRVRSEKRSMQARELRDVAASLTRAFMARGT
jgi:hypothetical protein